MALRVYKYGEKVLRQKSQPVLLVTDELRRLSEEMLELMYDTMTFDFSSSCSNMLDVVIRDQLRPLLSTGEKVAPTVKAWKDKVSNSLITINTNMNA